MGRKAGSIRIHVAIALLVGLVARLAAAQSTTVNAVFNGTEREMPNRLARDGTPTTCEMESFPGTFAGPSFWQDFLFCNGGEETCFTATFNEGTCDNDVHLEAYLDPFNPNDLAMNFIGDVGLSDTESFSFVVPAGAQFLIVAQTNFGMADCAFSFTINALPCPATTTAPALSGAALALVACALLLMGSVALRRSRHTLPVLLLCALIALFAGPAAAPLAADPTPAEPYRQCALSCSAAYKACAKERCDSSAMDKDPVCLSECRRSHDACLQECP